MGASAVTTALFRVKVSEYVGFGCGVCVCAASGFKCKAKAHMLFSYLFRWLTCNVLSICYIYLFDKQKCLPYVHPPEITAVRGTTVLNPESNPAPCSICVTSAVKSLGVNAADCIRALVQVRGGKQVGGTDIIWAWTPAMWLSKHYHTT